MGETTNIVWFKRDLRIHDHPVLRAAGEQGRVIPLFIVEPALWHQPDMSARQWNFVRECLCALRSDLSQLGQPLIVRVGDVVDVLSALKTRFGSIRLWSHEETGNAWTYARDRRVAQWARNAGIEWIERPQCGVVRRLKNRAGWARRWHALMSAPLDTAPDALAPIRDLDPGMIPDYKDLGLQTDLCPDRQCGGSAIAGAILDSFLTDRAAGYRRAMSSPIASAHHCSRLSPYLAWGALSLRQTAQATWARKRALEQDPTGRAWGGAITSFQSRLSWRDHFMQKLEDEPRLEFSALHSAYDGLRPADSDSARYHSWCNGETGLPFVDACMRSLKARGWINFRMRAMLMAVASYHLWLDWRAPGEHLARLFVDYEPGIHWPQVQMQSGTTGINAIRIYNPVKQGYDQDPDGDFVRRWVPEISHLPGGTIHEPWKSAPGRDVLDKTYPAPIINHLEAAKYARETIWAVRKGENFRQEASAVMKRHGSRKRRARARPQKQQSTAQLVLPL